LRRLKVNEIELIERKMTEEAGRRVREAAPQNTRLAEASELLVHRGAKMGERGRKVVPPVAREELAMDLPQTAKLCAGGEGQGGPREQRRAHGLIGMVEYEHQCEQLDVGECCRNLGEEWRITGGVGVDEELEFKGTHKGQVRDIDGFPKF
jgi:hypothetical protein